MGCAVLALLLWSLVDYNRFGPAAAAAAIATYLSMSMLVWRRLDALELPRFGAANSVTVLRAAVIATLPAFIFEADRLDAPLAWAVIAGGTFALILDGVDGRTARQRGEVTPFGARFDMEVDAFFVLGLAALVAATGRTGSWVLLGGLMRYLWVGAGALWPVLRGPVPPSLFRKAVCVVQLLILLLALVPELPSPGPTVLCALGLALLVASFGRDLVWLVRGGGMVVGASMPYIGNDGRV
jgi:phosphatidylglycerophosphate synthase